MTEDELNPPGLKTFYWHYAWVIVVIIASMQIVGTSIRMAFGVFIDPLQAQFGWSQGGIAFAYAITSVVSAVVSPWAGNLGDKYGAKNAMVVGTIIYLVGMLATAFVTTLWQFWFTYGVILGIAQAIFLVPLIPAAMIWFRRHLGMAMGLVMASWGLGPALATPLVAYMIESYGWTFAFLSIGIVTTLIMFFLIAVFRNRPADVGSEAYGTVSGDPSLSDKLPPAVLLKEFKGHMKKTAAYWNMSSIHFLGCVGHAVILIWIIPMATSKGLTPIDASLILTLFSAVSIATRLTTPMLCEKMGVRTVMTVFYILQGAPVLLLIFSSADSVFIVFAVTFGIGYGGETGGFPILNRKYFGHAPMGGAHGFQMLGAGIGMAVGGWIGGPVFDIFNSYNAAFWISVLASFGGALSIVLLENPAKLIIPDWRKSEEEYQRTVEVIS
jgi:MFS family permease